ncbi:histidine kinase [Chitinophaga skermanii]|uniref:histidine kinase n=1 Tax=Chitinophaga skermanii TaxID=331697 RepID=A0A327QHZ9_9BACT|nr:histidine kinase [Chitinophaga skermanii]RAJ04236.1 histidine kinase [Chitinophaga skermanii]
MQAIIDNIYIVVILAMGGTCMLVILFLLLHVRNQNKLLQQKQQLQQNAISHQKELTLAVFTSQEAERQRIGSDLHDSVGAALSTLRLSVDQILAMNNDPVYKQQFKSQIDKIITDVRNISHNISPAILKLYGLAEAIDELVMIINQTQQLHIVVDMEADGILEALPYPTSLSIYRVIEELLNNTIKHANANGAYLKLYRTGPQLSILYTDNGKGLAAGNKKGMGLLNITNRLEVINASWQIGHPAHSGFYININI